MDMLADGEVNEREEGDLAIWKGTSADTDELLATIALTVHTS
jgi:hypothetical protein